MRRRHDQHIRAAERQHPAVTPRQHRDEPWRRPAATGAGGDLRRPVPGQCGRRDRGSRRPLPLPVRSGRHADRLPERPPRRPDRQCPAAVRQRHSPGHLHRRGRRQAAPPRHPRPRGYHRPGRRSAGLGHADDLRRRSVGAGPIRHPAEPRRVQGVSGPELCHRRPRARGSARIAHRRHRRDRRLRAAPAPPASPDRRGHRRDCRGLDHLDRRARRGDPPADRPLCGLRLADRRRRSAAPQPALDLSPRLGHPGPAGPGWPSTQSGTWPATGRIIRWTPSRGRPPPRRPPGRG